LPLGREQGIMSGLFARVVVAIVLILGCFSQLIPSAHPTEAAECCAAPCGESVPDDPAAVERSPLDPAKRQQRKHVFAPPAQLSDDPPASSLFHPPRSAA
jgi:hypothetical protein